MPDTTNTNDIDALLVLLHDGGWKDFHRALTALVAERDELKQCHAHLSQSYTMLAREYDALKRRVAELEAQPPAASDLRERLVCAALTGLCADPRHDVAESVAVAIADRTLAAMRKGDTNGK